MSRLWRTNRRTNERKVENRAVFCWTRNRKNLICQTVFQLLCRAADSDIQLMKISLTEYLLSIISRKYKIPHVWRNSFVYCVYGGKRQHLISSRTSSTLRRDAKAGHPPGRISKLFDNIHVTFLREGVKKNGFIWDFVPNIGPHPPTAHVWDKDLNKRFFLHLP